VLRAACHVVDPTGTQSVELKLNADGCPQIDARLFTRASDNNPFVGRVRDGLGHIVAHFEAAGTDAGPNRNNERPAGERLQRGVHDPRHHSAPTRVDRRGIAARLVPDKHRHAIGDTHPHGDRPAVSARDDGVGLRGCAVLERLDGTGGVHLFGLHDVPGVGDLQSRSKSAVAAVSLGKSVTEPGPNEKRRLQEDHADR